MFCSYQDRQTQTVGEASLLSPHQRRFPRDMCLCYLCHVQEHTASSILSVPVNWSRNKRVGVVVGGCRLGLVRMGKTVPDCPVRLARCHRATVLGTVPLLSPARSPTWNPTSEPALAGWAVERALALCSGLQAAPLLPTWP